MPRENLLRFQVPRVGDLLGAYRLLERIEVGGMARIFRAEDVRNEYQKAAVKVLAPELAREPEMVTRFSREARITRFFDHPNIVRIYDIVDSVPAPYPPYMAMELLEGQDLHQRVRERRVLAPGEVKEIARRVADTLAVVHASGVLHRDVKPGNIFLHRRQEPITGDVPFWCEHTVKLLDFGVALALTLPSKTRLTQHGACVGTPDYISPEQVLGKDVDERSDIYGMGLLMYELLAGQNPFKSRIPRDTLLAQVDTYPPAIEQIRGEPIPTDLEEVVMRCLRKQPDDRYASMELLSNALQACV